MKALGGFLSLLVLGACSSSSTTASPPVLTDPDGAASNCSWPAMFNSSAPDVCHAARYQLSCTSGGLTELCLSDSPTQCSGSMPVAGCASQCAADQYGLVCDLNTGAVASAPGGCVGSGGVTPGGTAYYCCPCSGG